jgi:hypothetical protein
MWVWAVFGVVAVLIWLVIAGSARLTTRFEYTKKSLWGLYMCGVVSIVLGMCFGLRTLEWPPVFGAMAGTVASGVIFIGLANAMTEAWLRTRLAMYDNAIERLLDDEYRQRNKLESARDRMHGESLGQQGAFHRQREMEERRADLQAMVDSWQQGGGVTRIRSVKAQEWRQLFSSMSEDALARERERLKSETAMASGRDEQSIERQRQIKAELAVLDIEVIERHMPDPAEIPPVESLLADQEQVKGNLEGIRDKLAEWRRERAMFLSGKIRLE